MSVVAPPRRGDLWLADFDPVIGREQGEVRPALVLSVDPFNAGPRGLLALMPLTSHVRGWNVHVPVTPPEGGLLRPSDIMCEQMRFLSRTRLKRRLGAVQPATMRAVEIVVLRLLGL